MNALSRLRARMLEDVALASAASDWKEAKRDEVHPFYRFMHTFDDAHVIY
jgi:hypothetical protein